MLVEPMKPEPSSLPPIKNDSRDVVFEALKPAYVWIARQVPRAVTPNQLTLAGLGCAASAAIVLLLWRNNAACFVAAGLLFLYETFDALDGLHARNTGQSSLFGAYLDAIVDSAQAGLIYFVLLVRYELYAPIYIFVLALRMMLACWIHAYTAESRIRVNPAFGSTVENYMIVGTLAAAGLFPGNLRLLPTDTGDGPLLRFLTDERLTQINIIQASFLAGLVITALIGYGLVREAWRTLTAPPA